LFKKKIKWLILLNNNARNIYQKKEKKEKFNKFYCSILILLSKEMY